MKRITNEQREAIVRRAVAERDSLAARKAHHMSNSTSPKESESAGVEMPELPHLQVAALKHLAGPFNEAWTRDEVYSYAIAYGNACARAATAAERERAAAKADSWSVPANVRLAAGELTAQELRTAQAVAAGIAAAIRA
jgi:hypothetical protein